MKIRNPRLLRALAWLGARAIQGWIGSLTYRYQPLASPATPQTLPPGKRVIYAFWHETMLLPAYHYAVPNAHVLISTHSDGQLITDVCKHLGLNAVRGSSTRGGTEALREMIRLARTSHLVITPDGPRGPRRIVQQGIIYLAARTGLPIVPVGFAYDHCVRAKSWDRFALPMPLTRAYCVTGHEFSVPKSVTPEQVEPFRQRLQEAMNATMATAEEWAVTRRFRAIESVEVAGLRRAA